MTWDARKLHRSKRTAPTPAQPSDADLEKLTTPDPPPATPPAAPPKPIGKK